MCGGENLCAAAGKSMCGGENLAFLKLSPTPREFQTRKISPFRFRPGAKENEQNYPGKILSRPVKSAGERDLKTLKNALCRAYSLCACLPERIARISRSEILLAPDGFDKKREFPCLRPAHGPNMVRAWPVHGLKSRKFGMHQRNPFRIKRAGPKNWHPHFLKCP